KPARSWNGKFVSIRLDASDSWIKTVSFSKNARRSQYSTNTFNYPIPWLITATPALAPGSRLFAGCWLKAEGRSADTRSRGKAGTGTAIGRNCGGGKD